MTWLEENVGVRGPGELYEHSCEIPGRLQATPRPRNLCINPEHVSIGTKSSNALTMYQRHREEGLKLGGRPLGMKMAPEVGRKISASLKGRPKSPEHRANLSKAHRESWARRKAQPRPT